MIELNGNTDQSKWTVIGDRSNPMFFENVKVLNSNSLSAPFSFRKLNFLIEFGYSLYNETEPMKMNYPKQIKLIVSLLHTRKFGCLMQ